MTDDNKPLLMQVWDFRKVIFKVAWAIFLFILIYRQFYHPTPPPTPNDPVNIKIEADFKHEFEILKPLPERNVYMPVSTGIAGVSESVGYNFSTKKGEAEVYDHYIEQLRANGWRYYGTGKYDLSDHNGRFRGFSKIYKKGEYFVECYFIKEIKLNSGDIGSFHIFFYWQKEGIPVTTVKPDKNDK